MKIRTPRGVIYAMYHSRSNEIGEATADCTVMSFKKAHSLLGHVSEDYTRATAKVLGWKITRGTLGACDACTTAKAKQKNVPKRKEEKSNTDG
jgi:hypothetical protein